MTFLEAEEDEEEEELDEEPELDEESELELEPELDEELELESESELELECLCFLAKAEPARMAEVKKRVVVNFILLEASPTLIPPAFYTHFRQFPGFGKLQNVTPGPSDYDWSIERSLAELHPFRQIARSGRTNLAVANYQIAADGN